MILRVLYAYETPRGLVVEEELRVEGPHPIACLRTFRAAFAMERPGCLLKRVVAVRWWAPIAVTTET